MFQRLISLLMVIVTICSLVTASAGSARDDLTSATISGSVVDVNGAVVPDVKIAIINDRVGLQRGTVTDNQGLFEIPFLRPGVYTLTAQMRGFATVMVTGIDAQSGLDRKIMVVLQPGLASETIRVDADNNNSINASDATLRYSIGKEQVESYPVIGTLQGRNLMETIPFLLPGILPGFSAGTRGEGLVVNGARPLSNVFTIDGGDNNDYELNKAASPFPNPDAVQEIDIVANNYKADIGGGTGGIFNVVTKSGGNQLHGNIRYFSILPVGSLDTSGVQVVVSAAAAAATSFLQRPVGSLNTFGGQVGGPLVLPGIYDGRNRTHFFADYEGNQVTVKRLVTIDGLTASERSGDFSSLPPYDPHAIGTQPLDPLTGAPFPGGKIPANRFDPIARLYLDRFLAQPTAASGSFQQLESSSQRSRQLTSRVDHNIGASDILSATYFYNLLSGDSPVDLPSGTNKTRQANHSLILRETHVFSARTVNEVSGTATHYSDGFALQQPGFTGIDPRDAGFNIRPQTNRFLSLPSVSIISDLADSSFAVVTVGFPYLSFYKDQTKTTLSLKDVFTHALGNHTLTLGGSIRSFLLDKYLPNNNGQFAFDDNNQNGTGNAVADFLLGIPSYYEQDTGNTQHQRQTAYSFFGTDSWKLRSNLTINLGLRYELTPPVTDTRDQVSVFRPGETSKRFPTAPPGQLFAGDPDPLLGTVPRGGYLTDKNNLAPRVAVAYSPGARAGFPRWLFGDGKSSIRAGFGVFYVATYGSTFSDYSITPPFSSGVALEPGGSFGPSLGSFANPFGSSPNPFPIPLDQRRLDFFSAIHTFDPAFRSAYSYQYNLTIQRQLPWSMLLELSYVGSNSFKLDRQRDLNPPSPDPDHPGWVTSPYGGFFSLTSQESTGRARYDSFQARVSRRFRGGLQLDGFYVFSKSLDNASSPWSPIIGGFNRQFGTDEVPQSSDPFTWARSAFDRHHSVVVSYTYHLPRLRSKDLWGQLTSGWLVGGFTGLHTGSPMDITSYQTGFPSSFLAGRPDIVGSYRRVDPREERTFTINGVATTGHFFFDPTVFRAPPAERPGNLGRNVFDGPGASVTSISIAKRTDLFRSHQIEFRADVLNLFDQLNFGEPNLTVNSAYFGQVGLGGPRRSIQLSLRYRF